MQRGERDLISHSQVTIVAFASRTSKRSVLGRSSRGRLLGAAEVPGEGRGASHSRAQRLERRPLSGPRAVAIMALYQRLN